MKNKKVMAILGLATLTANLGYASLVLAQSTTTGEQQIDCPAYSATSNPVVFDSNIYLNSDNTLSGLQALEDVDSPTSAPQILGTVSSIIFESRDVAFSNSTPATPQTISYNDGGPQTIAASPSQSMLIFLTELTNPGVSGSNCAIEVDGQAPLNISADRLVNTLSPTPADEEIIVQWSPDGTVDASTCSPPCAIEDLDTTPGIIPPLFSDSAFTDATTNNYIEGNPIGTSGTITGNGALGLFSIAFDHFMTVKDPSDSVPYTPGNYSGTITLTIPQTTTLTITGYNAA